MSVAGTRGRGEHLFPDELADMKDDLRDGQRVNFIAKKFGCSSRVVQKWAKVWGIAKRYTYEPTSWRTPMKEFEKFKAKPHMAPGITVEMLMGGRAPVARSRP